MQQRVEDARGHAEPQVPDDELRHVGPAVVAVEHAGRRNAVGHVGVQVGVQVGPDAHDDPAEHAVDRAGDQTPPGEVVVVRDGADRPRRDEDEQVRL